MQEPQNRQLRAQYGERDQDNVSGHEQYRCQRLATAREIRVPRGDHEHGDAPPQQGAGPVRLLGFSHQRMGTIPVVQNSVNVVLRLRLGLD